MNKTSVIFRTFKKEGSVIALFPFVPADNAGWNCLSYMRVGQHSAATPDLMRGTTRQTTRKESAPLRAELRRIGYKLAELKRFPRTAFDTRKKNLETA